MHIETGRVTRSNPHAHTCTVVIEGDATRTLEDVSIVGADHYMGASSLRRPAPGDIVDVGVSDTRAKVIAVTGRNSAVRTDCMQWGLCASDWGHRPSRDEVLKTHGARAPRHGDSTLYAGVSEGSLNEFGVGYGHTSLAAFIKASPLASVETFAQDNLLRLTGYNSETRTSMGETRVVASGLTASQTTAESWFIHETLGKNTAKEGPRVLSAWKILYPELDEATARQTYDDLLAAVKANQDPVDREELDRLHLLYEQHQDDQPQILPRRVSINGYLGNGLCDWVVRPASANIVEDHEDVEATGIENDSRHYPSGSTVAQGGKAFTEEFLPTRRHPTAIPLLTGLSEIQRAADGRLRLTSAKAISLVKEPLIPVPYEHPVARDPAADDTQPAAHREDVWTESPSEATRAAARKELLLRRLDRRFADAHPGISYPEDNSILAAYFASQAAERTSTTGVDYRPSRLEKHEYALPPNVELRVDDKTQSRYYAGTAGLHLTEDGSVIIRDAYGSSIVLSGGNIYLNCPGDIWEFPGRDKNTWAGRNVNTKAHENLELVSSNGQARLKAEKQLLLAGGMGGLDGGVLIESRGETVAPDATGRLMSTGGVVVKSVSHVSVGSPVLGIEVPLVAIKGSLAVDTVIDTPLIRTADLQAATGDFGGISKYALNAQHAMQGGSSSGGSGEGSDAPNPDVDETTVVVDGVTAARGFIAPQTVFKFNTSAEYGYTPEYGLTLVESWWQSRDRLASPTDFRKWSEPEIEGPDGMPHPGKAIWAAEVLRRPKTSDDFKLDPSDADVYDFENVALRDAFVIT